VLKLQLSAYNLESRTRNIPVGGGPGVFSAKPDRKEHTKSFQECFEICGPNPDCAMLARTLSGLVNSCFLGEASQGYINPPGWPSMRWSRSKVTAGLMLIRRLYLLLGHRDCLSFAKSRLSLFSVILHVCDLQPLICQCSMSLWADPFNQLNAPILQL
jgi:hypothetical protein